MSNPSADPRFYYRDAPTYGWPFYAVRRALRWGGRAMLGAADALSMREKYAPVSLFRPPLPQNADLRDCHRGRRCFVIGNGPSLAQHDLAPLAGELTVTMNAFVRHPLLDVVRPTYWVFADGVFFDGSEPSRTFLADVNRRAAHTTFVAPYSAARGITEGRWLDPGRTRFVAFGGNIRSARLRDIDLTRTIPSVTSCAQMGLLLALHMGCSPIYLLGLDHDWLSHRGEYRHFYPGLTMAGHDGCVNDYGTVPYLAVLESVADLWRGYGTIREYARKRDVEIVNCTPGGFLDVYPRGDFAEVVGARPGEATMARAA